MKIRHIRVDQVITYDVSELGRFRRFGERCWEQLLENGSWYLVRQEMLIDHLEGLLPCD